MEPIVVIVAFFIVISLALAIHHLIYKKSPGVISDDLEETEKNFDQFINQSTEELQDLGNMSGPRDLVVDSLILPSMGKFGDAINLIKTGSDPLVKLCVVYAFLENLHPDSSAKSSGLNLLAFELFKTNLTDEEWQYNFSDDEPNTGHFETPLFWISGMYNRISGVLDQCPDMVTKCNICADFCGELTSVIDDDKLLDQFSKLARKHLKSDNFYTEEAEASLAALEL